MKIPKYREFIEDNFLIRDKTGKVTPFKLNDVQATYLDILQKDYPTLQGIRENILKARQEGFSSIIDAIFTADFIFSALGYAPVITGQIISHKAEETRILFRRVDFFLQSFLDRNKIERSQILRNDSDSYLEAKSGAELYIGTAGARTLGRGGTLQNLHWSEIAFYPNTPILNAAEIVGPAEQQVADGVGKIFRESTGNRMFDLFHREYEAGKRPDRASGQSRDGRDDSSVFAGDFTSRFFPWFVERSYRRQAPAGWEVPAHYLPLLESHQLDVDQIYWHWKKVTKPDDGDTLKAKREYPSTDLEAFLAAGEQYFNAEALHLYKTQNVQEPMIQGNVYA